MLRYSFRACFGIHYISQQMFLVIEHTQHIQLLRVSAPRCHLQGDTITKVYEPNISSLFLRGNPVVLIKLKDNKIVPGFIQT
jgi:hypothetical protein